MKPLVRREQADLDVQAAINWYLSSSAEQVLPLIDALEQAYRHVEDRPGTGSTRYAHELNIPGLRFWPCKRFPYLVFYMELADHIEVWRVLHGRRDLPPTLSP